jgi:hypothetical protein
MFFENLLRDSGLRVAQAEGRHTAGPWSGAVAAAAGLRVAQAEGRHTASVFFTRGNQPA